MEKLLSAPQVADYLGYHVKTLYKLLRENRIALNFIRTHDRTIAFRPSDVESYLNDREVVRSGNSPKKPRKQAKAKIDRSNKGQGYNYFSDKEAQEFFTMTDQEARKFFANRDENGNSTSIHFHIRWAKGKDLDWHRFKSRGEAKKHANEVGTLNETFTIEEAGDSCRCNRPKE